MGSIEIDLEITSGGNGGEYSVRVLDAATDAEARTTMQLDVDRAVNGLRLLEYSLLASAGAFTRRVPSGSEEPLNEIGLLLFKALFTGAVRDVYRSSQDRARQQGVHLRIVLRLAAPELGLLPWEAMWDPDDERYVCLQEPLVRRVLGTSTPEPLPVTPPLSILGLVSSPKDLPALDADTEKQRLEEALHEHIASKEVEITWVPEASWDSVHDRMLTGRWHVLHFIGHGGYDAIRDEGRLALVGADGDSEWVQASRLAALLDEAEPAIRLVVLNSCMSARGGTHDIFSGTAATLVRGGVSAVAAMQFSFSDPAAIAFSRGFYSSLSAGRGVDGAMRSGRIAILGKSLEWVTPVLYVSGDTQVLSVARREPTSDVDRSRDIDHVTVPAGGTQRPPASDRRSAELPSRSDSNDREAPVDQAADELAARLVQHWRHETSVGPLDESSLLSVAWTAADPSVTVSWDELADFAEQMSHRIPDTAGETWGDDSGNLAGSGRDLPHVLARVPTGWLVVLGEPGSGKTLLVVRWVLDVLERRQRERPHSGGPVPVLVPIASWDPVAQDLHTWLEDRLTNEHPALSELVATDGGEKTRIAALLDERKILPVLDGLDEMPLRVLRKAIARLNETAGPLKRPRPLQLLITCRTEEFRQAVGEYGEGRVPLHGAAAIELQPLGIEQVVRYLNDDGRDTRWEPVEEALSQPTAVRDALRTPPAVRLADAIYNARLETQPDQEVAKRNPADLCRPDRFPTAESILDHLFDASIPSAYLIDGDRAVDAARQRLTILAGYLENRRQTTLLRWWELEGLAPNGLVPIVVGVICGMATGLAAASGKHVGIGIGIGFGVGMLVALAIALTIRYATHFENPDPGGGMAGALIGAALGSVAAGVAAKMGLGHATSTFSGFPEALGIGLGAGASTRFVGGLAGGLVGGFVGAALEGVGLGLPAGLVNGLGVGLAAGLAVTYVGRRKPARRSPRWTARIGIPGGVVIGSSVGLLMWRESGVPAGIVIGTVIGTASAWPFGLRDTDEDLRWVASPADALARDASAFIRTCIAGGLAAAAVGFMGGALASIWEVGAQPSLYRFVADGLGIGLSSGLVVGLTFGFYHAASPTFRIVNWWMALRGKLPWRLMHFFDDAHNKGILRQSGPEYQFRQQMLQQHLASSDQTARNRRPW